MASSFALHRHALVPVRQDVVPKEDLDRMRAKGLVD